MYVPIRAEDRMCAQDVCSCPRFFFFLSPVWFLLQSPILSNTVQELQDYLTETYDQLFPYLSKVCTYLLALAHAPLGTPCLCLVRFH